MRFLEKIAVYVKENNLNLKDLTIVIPSERAKKYLSSELYKAYQKPIISPEIITMSKWVASHSESAVIDRTRALLILYRIHLNVISEDEQTSFDEFLSWGDLLISDFNEIDRYLIDAESIFNNLADIKEIENWSFNSEELTDSQKDFMKFWDRLPKYYKSFSKSLDENNLLNSGLVYKNLSENIDLLFKKNKDSHYLFVGFNALSLAEKSIMKQVCRLGRGEVFVDSDEYYVKNTFHEAGRFIRDLGSYLEVSKLDYVQDDLCSKNMNLEIIECTQFVGQVKVAGSILSQYSPEQLNDTLLLLADESLIGAMLKNLPKNIQKANITLGLPIKSTAVRTWMDLIFQIQENKLRFKTEWLYHKDVKSFLRHPFIQGVSNLSDDEYFIALEQENTKYNRIFIDPEKLKIDGLIGEIGTKVFNNWNSDWNASILNIRELNRLVFGQLGEEFTFDKAAIQAFDSALVDFENIVSEGMPEMSLKSYKLLFNSHWVSKSISYHGNPTDGLQIMGLLETRGLDFKNIICLGMNEGNLPPTNPIQTLIPMDLRRYFGMPTPREKQGLFAHHFYRLLHKCENLVVTYCSSNDSFGSGELSRYILQIEKELDRKNENLKIAKKVALIDGDEFKEEEVTKTPALLAKIDEVLKDSVSASMLKSYIDCPLNFYYKYIIGLNDSASIEEEIAARNLGTFIHETLEDLYRPFSRRDKGGELVSPPPRNITSSDIEIMLKNYIVILDEKLLKFFDNKKEVFSSGKNYLAYSVTKNLIEKFLKSEIKFISSLKEPLFIESLEQKFTEDVELDINGSKKVLRVNGVIDRIDSYGNKIRIIDYKSGKVDRDDVFSNGKGADSESYLLNINKKHVLQLMQYAYMYRNQWQPDQRLEVSIISFISNDSIPFELDIAGYSLREIIDNYPVYLKGIVESMYDVRNNLTHEKKSLYCNYCE